MKLISNIIIDYENLVPFKPIDVDELTIYPPFVNHALTEDNGDLVVMWLTPLVDARVSMRLPSMQDLVEWSQRLDAREKWQEDVLGVHPSISSRLLLATCHAITSFYKDLDDDDIDDGILPYIVICRAVVELGAREANVEGWTGMYEDNLWEIAALFQR